MDLRRCEKIKEESSWATAAVRMRDDESEEEGCQAGKAE